MPYRQIHPRLGAPAGARQFAERVTDVQPLSEDRRQIPSPGKARDWLARGLAATAFSAWSAMQAALTT